MLNEIKSARRSRSIIAAHFTSFYDRIIGHPEKTRIGTIRRIRLPQCAGYARRAIASAQYVICPPQSDLSIARAYAARCRNENVFVIPDRRICAQVRGRPPRRRQATLAGRVFAAGMPHASPWRSAARAAGAKPRRPRARDLGSTVWSVGDSLSTPMPTSRAAGRPAVQSRTFRASRATRRFSRYRQSRPSISYLNIRANFV